MSDLPDTLMRIMMRDEWRSVVGFPQYEIRADAQVRRVDRGDGRPGDLLTWQVDRGGYPRVHLSLGGGRQKSLKLHRALLEAFVGPPPNPGCFALHADDDPSNLRLSNLRWGTRDDNFADARANGGTAKIAEWRRARTHCDNGHELSGENVRAAITRAGYEYRACRACGREKQRRYRASRAA